MEQDSQQPPELKSIVEALLVASPQPLSTHEIVQIIRSAGEAAREELRAEAEAEAEAEAAARADEDEDDDAGGEKDADKPSTKGGKAPADGKKGKKKQRVAASEVIGIFEAAERVEMAFLKVTEEEVAAAIAVLIDEWKATGRAFTLHERVEGWRIYTVGGLAPWVRHLFPDKKPERLSAPALETLAIIAYRQPIAKAAIEAVRGVSVDGVLQKLLDRNIVRIAGRSELPGRPLLYETTELFFEHFGIRSVDELPNAAELRSVPLPEPEPEATAEVPADEDGGEAIEEGKTDDADAENPDEPAEGGDRGPETESPAPEEASGTKAPVGHDADGDGPAPDAEASDVEK